ncbi:MAG: PIN domain-containing protein [Acidobacteria bacterium]|nr:PIN domain-containing protein [Acidobacteriota bacterium]
MAKVFWDTNLFIYLFENHPTLAEQVERVRLRMIERSDRLFTSALTVGEILVRPVRTGRPDLEDRYRQLFQPPTVTVIAFDATAAIQYARIRKDPTIKPPDAIQLACAAVVGADLFVTNDDRLSRKLVAGIQFIVGLEKAPF